VGKEIKKGLMIIVSTGTVLCTQYQFESLQKAATCGAFAFAVLAIMGVYYIVKALMKK